MKFTILGYNQDQAIKFNLDLVDLTILRYFIDFRDTEEMICKIINDKPYYWVNYESLIKEIPIIGINNKIALRRRLKKLEENKILIHSCIKENGTYSYYGTGVNYKYLISDTVKLESLTGTIEKFKGVKPESLTGTTEKFNQNINLLKDQSIKNNIYINIIEHLNKMAGTKYNYKSKVTQKLINARINEGYKEKDFIQVINIKCQEWKNTEFEKYLRPGTLFGTKFENYLNQKGAQNNGRIKQDINTNTQEYDFSSL